ncbi:MAG TPA: LLM class flavin-dependent oxidoreductase [Candidatus Limnocylindrales bacterium]|nr:LLM class flavin-dependent oxidoreductase [Candidatus Limnocylindrales bacterium]
MKISMFHLMPYRDLPVDFERRYHSVWVDPPWWELADAQKVGQYYNWTLDELIYAAQAGLDGICVNEHHQNAYGFMASPNLMGSVLARATHSMDVAIVQMGSTLPTTIPPIRIAEEYGMLDCISGGRLVAGMPLGTSMDANLCYGISPMEQRERYYEAHDLILKAWQAKEIFAWNGKYYQLPMVNLWPRPIQQPHPPIWVPGLGSLSTWDFVTRQDYCYCYLSYYGSKLSQRIMDGFWEFVEVRGLEPNPYRAGFLQLVVVSETDARAEAEYFPHIRYFYNKCLHIAPEFYLAPGYLDYRSLENSLKKGFIKTQREIREKIHHWQYKDFVENGLVIGGSPISVREQLEEAIRNLRVGNLMVLLHIGSMPHDLTLKNIELFSKEVFPHLQDLWDDQWENKWWPVQLRKRRQPVGGASNSKISF